MIKYNSLWQSWQIYIINCNSLYDVGIFKICYIMYISRVKMNILKVTLGEKLPFVQHCYKYILTKVHCMKHIVLFHTAILPK